VAKKIAKCVTNKKKIDCRDPTFKKYQSGLCEHVIDCTDMKNGNAKFHDKFVNSFSVDPVVKAFRSALGECMTISSSCVILVSKDFLKNDSSTGLKFDQVQSTEIESFLGALKIVVTPNEQILSNIITDELGNKFNAIDLKTCSADFRCSTG
jgi:hypothetical protein